MRIAVVASAAIAFTGACSASHPAPVPAPKPSAAVAVPAPPTAAVALPCANADLEQRLGTAGYSVIGSGAPGGPPLLDAAEWWPSWTERVTKDGDIVDLEIDCLGEGPGSAADAPGTRRGFQVAVDDSALIRVGWSTHRRRRVHDIVEPVSAGIAHRAAPPPAAPAQPPPPDDLTPIAHQVLASFTAPAKALDEVRAPAFAATLQRLGLKVEDDTERRTPGSFWGEREDDRRGWGDDVSHAYRSLGNADGNSDPAIELDLEIVSFQRAIADGHARRFGTMLLYVNVKTARDDAAARRVLAAIGG